MAKEEYGEALVKKAVNEVIMLEILELATEALESAEEMHGEPLYMNEAGEPVDVVSIVKSAMKKIDEEYDEE